jgi:hypothetical protein
MIFKEYIILYMYRIAFSWIVATLSQLCRNSVATLRNSVATLSQLCRNFAQLCRNSVATLSQLCRNSVATLSQLCATLSQLCATLSQLCATLSQLCATLRNSIAKTPPFSFPPTRKIAGPRTRFGGKSKSFPQPYSGSARGGSQRWG